MKRARSALIAAAVAAMAMAFSTPALAATEFGSDCAANSGTPGSLVAIAKQASNPLPVAAPVSGVITSWRQNSKLEVPPELVSVLSQRLQVLRPTGAPNEFTVVGESEPGTFATGTATNPTRLPIQAGDHLGTRASYAAIYCATEGPESVVGALPGSAIGLGETQTYTPVSGVELPAVAVIEPDVDGDEYGDETQDGCPQSALYHEACPVVKIDSSSFGPGKRSVVVFVTSDTTTEVSLRGIVGLGKGRKARLKPQTKTVGAGTIRRFKLPFPSGLRKRLRQLPRKQKLTLRTTADAVNVAGRISTDRLKIRLAGQAR